MEMSDLEACVAPATIDGQRLLRALEPLLVVLASPMPDIAGHLASSLPALAAELGTRGSCDSADLECAARLGARALIIYERPDALKTSLRQWLSAGSARVVMSEVGASLESDAVLATELCAAFSELTLHLDALQLESTVGANRVVRPNYRQLSRAASALAQARGEFDAALRSFASWLVMDIALAAVRHSLTPALRGADGEPRALWDAISEMTRVLADWFEHKGWLRRRDGHLPWSLLLGEACRSLVARWIVEPIVPLVLNQLTEGMASLESWLRVATDANANSDEHERLWYLANRTVQGGIAAFISASQAHLVSTLAARIGALANDARERTVELVGLGGLSQAVVEWSASSTDAWEWINWDRFSGDQLRRALESLGSAFAATRSFDIVIPLTGANTEPTSWSTGRFTWYTPHTHSLGEVELQTADAARERSIHVWIRVDAPTAEAAHERARAMLEPALSCLTFALSSGQQVTGFRPGWDFWFGYGDVLHGYGGSRWSRHRTELFDGQIGASQLQQFCSAYAPVIERTITAATHSDIESRILRAMFWYRSGRWQRDPVRRFLDHFVALEHLFAAGSGPKDEAVANGVGALEGSWLFRGFPFSASLRATIDHARLLLTEAESRIEVGAAAQQVADDGLSSCVNAAHWRTHLSPWLSPSFVQAVASLLRQPLPEPWVSHTADLLRRQARQSTWEAADTSRAERAWFKMRLLAQRRHDIVHEALTYAPGIEYEADALTQVVESVLRHLTEDALTRPLAANTMHDVLNNLAPPWLS